MALPHDPARAALVRALLLRAEGQAPDARTVLDEALGRLGTAPLDPALVRLRLMRLEVARDLGDLAGARQRARSLYGETRLKGQPALWTQICLAMARAHLDAGEVMAAERRIVEAERTWPTEPLSSLTIEIALVRVQHQCLAVDAVTAGASLKRLEGYAPWAKLLARREARGERALLGARIAGVRAARAYRVGDATARAAARETLLEALKPLRETLPPHVGWIQTLTGLAELLADARTAVVERLERLVPRPGDPHARALAAGILSLARTRPEVADEDLRHGETILRDTGAAPPPEAVALGLFERP
jgi:hypothetical protein